MSVSKARQVWQGGQLYQARNGDEIFVPTGAARRDVPKECGPLRYLGPAMKQTKGWGADGQPPRAELLPQSH
jgi:hypothetical protein